MKTTEVETQGGHPLWLSNFTRDVPPPPPFIQVLFFHKQIILGSVHK